MKPSAIEMRIRTESRIVVERVFKNHFEEIQNGKDVVPLIRKYTKEHTPIEVIGKSENLINQIMENNSVEEIQEEL